MGVQYRISEKKLRTLYEWYRKFGYSEEDAEILSHTVFSHNVESDPQLPELPGWEIEFSSPVIRTKVKKQDNRTYSLWMKGGWNRNGSWEKVLETGPEEVITPVKLPLYGWNNSTGMSADYFRYMTGCGRNPVKEYIDPQDALYGLHAAAPECLSRIPVGLEAYSDDDYLCICADVRAELKAASHYVFAVDVSGSMRCRWILVQLSLAALFKALPEGAKVSLIAYSGKCDVIKTNINAGDNKAFINAVKNTPATGGFSASVPILQTAFGILHREEQKGIVTLFTDDAVRSGFPTAEVRDEYIREQVLSGNRLHILCYGSDSFLSDELRRMGMNGGRMRAVLSPEQLVTVRNENWFVPAENIHGFSINNAERNLKLVGGNTGIKGCLESFTLSPGCSSTAVFHNDGSYGQSSMLALDVTWKDDDDDQSFVEPVSIPVHTMTDEIRSLIKDAVDLLSIKEKLTGDS